MATNCVNWNVCGESAIANLGADAGWSWQVIKHFSFHVSHRDSSTFNELFAINMTVPNRFPFYFLFLIVIKCFYFLVDFHDLIYTGFVCTHRIHHIANASSVALIVAPISSGKKSFIMPITLSCMLCVSSSAQS